MNPTTSNKLPSVSELNTIKLRAESLALVLEQYQKSGDHGMLDTLETMRTELILAIVASDGVGQELIRRMETVKPDLLQDMPCKEAPVFSEGESATDSRNFPHTSHYIKRNLGALAGTMAAINERTSSNANRLTAAEAMAKHGGFYVPEKGYEPLFDVLMAAHDQAAKGKGRERHAGADDLPFLEQRMQRISDLLKTPDGMAYQIIKKVTEGLEMSDPKACERELLGAIVYTAGAILWLRDNWLLDGENGGGDQ